MSKIKIEYDLKSKNEKHAFTGKGIKNRNKIIFNDNGILTIVTLGNTIYLERKKDYYYKIGFNTSKTVKSTYIIPEGKLMIETVTKYIKQKEDSIQIEYSLTINNTFIDNFLLNLRYSIDT